MWKACECPPSHRACLEKDIVRRFSQADAGFKLCYTCRKPFQCGCTRRQAAPPRRYFPTRNRPQPCTHAVGGGACSSLPCCCACAVDNAASAWLRGLLVGEQAVEEAKARRDAALDKVEWQDILLGVFAFLALPAVGFTAFWVGRWSSSCPSA
jgi:hypothetical protein